MSVRRLLTIAILVLSVSAASAATVYTRPSVSSCMQGSFCFPTSDYLRRYPGDSGREMPVARSSLSYVVDVRPIDLGLRLAEGESLDFGVGISFCGFSESLPYGKSMLRAYNGFGTSAFFVYHFKGIFSLDAVYRYLECSFTGTDQKFVSMDFCISPSWNVIDCICVMTPVTLSWKADSLTLSIGVGFEVAYPQEGASR